jgi:nicotinamide-nucleotide amidase
VTQSPSSDTVVHPDQTQVVAEIIATLGERDLTIATCESLTGGMAGAALTSVPGSSTIFRGGLITYDTKLKVSLVGLDAKSAATYGVVNEQTAVQMARGAMVTCQTDVAVSCTGVAGPGPQDGVAAGDVWIALVTKRVGAEVAVYTQHLHLDGDRGQIREATTAAMLDLILRVLSPAVKR